MAQFAIGNKCSEKKFKSVEELENALEEYFQKCDNNTENVYDKVKQTIVSVNKPKPYTIEGVCIVLNCSRQTLLNYEKEEGYEAYFDTIKRAKLKILQNKVERGLMGDAPPAFAIFDLCNNSDYVNSQNVDHTSKGDKAFIVSPITLKPIE